MTNPNLPSTPQFLSWQEVDKLIDYVVPQLRPPYDALLMVGGSGPIAYVGQIQKI